MRSRRRATPRARQRRPPAPEPVTPLDPDSLDSPAEVDAAFRTQRRVSVGYALVFALMLLGVSVLTVALDWWTTGRIVGGISPGFLTAALGLYVVFVAVAAAATTLAAAIENRMLGRADHFWGDAAGPDGHRDEPADDRPPPPGGPRP